MRQEEIAACRLLERFFQERVDPTATCFPGDDPPDVVCKTATCRYAIEVTITSQQETLDGQTTARMERDIPLMQIGKRLGDATKNIRARDYLLILYGPPKGTKPRRWESALKRAVHDFVESDTEGNLQLEGASLTAYGPGNRWNVTVALRESATTPSGTPSYDIEANIRDMLRHALSAKVPKIAPLDGYSRKALLMCNAYFFGDEVRDIERIVDGLMRENPKFSVFDIIFYVSNNQLSLVHGEDRL